MPDTEKREEGKGLPKGPSGMPASGTGKDEVQAAQSSPSSSAGDPPRRLAARSPPEKFLLPRWMRLAARASASSPTASCLALSTQASPAERRRASTFMAWIWSICRRLSSPAGETRTRKAGVTIRMLTGSPRMRDRFQR